MAYTDNGTKWEAENSKLFIFAFFPILQAIPFFYMDSTIENKKWRKQAFLSLILSVILVLVGVLFIFSAGIEPYYVDKTDEPCIENYITQYEFQQKYADEIKNDNLLIQHTIESKMYEDAHTKWAFSNKVKSQEEKNKNFGMVMVSIGGTIFGILGLFTLIMIIVAFNERTKFLKLLAPTSAQAMSSPKYNPYMATSQQLKNNQNKNAVPVQQQPQQPVIPNDGKRNFEL